jgi:hypothetical protein
VEVRVSRREITAAVMNPGEPACRRVRMESGLLRSGRVTASPFPGLARAALHVVGRWRLCAAVCVQLGFLGWGAPRALAAPAFAPIAGSQFATGGTAESVAFGPGGGLLATLKPVSEVMVERPLHWRLVDQKRQI